MARNTWVWVYKCRTLTETPAAVIGGGDTAAQRLPALTILSAVFTPTVNCFFHLRSACKCCWLETPAGDLSVKICGMPSAEKGNFFFMLGVFNAIFCGSCGDKP